MLINFVTFICLCIFKLQKPNLTMCTQIPWLPTGERIKIVFSSPIISFFSAGVCYFGLLYDLLMTRVFIYHKLNNTFKLTQDRWIVLETSAMFDWNQIYEAEFRNEMQKIFRKQEEQRRKQYSAYLFVKFYGRHYLNSILIIMNLNGNYKHFLVLGQEV